MKIFDWVHRRFAHKEGLADSGGKKSCVIDGEGESDNNAANVFDGWKEGILTIGTLGYDPLKHEMERKDECFYAEQENDESSDSDEEEEANPLVYAANLAHDCDELFEIKREAANHVPQNEEFDFELEFDAMIRNFPKKERITLAELFSADSEKLMQKKEGSQKYIGENEMMMIKENKSKLFSFAKKLVGDKDARPIHKLHRMMRMMLKRKIHPDEGRDNVTTETASLLPAQAQPQDEII